MTNILLIIGIIVITYNSIQNQLFYKRRKVIDDLIEKRYKMDREHAKVNLERKKLENKHMKDRTRVLTFKEKDYKIVEKVLNKIGKIK